MEKLIELLNEFEKKEGGEFGQRWTYYDRGFHIGEEGYYYSELQLISKSYGFIKRLVKNNKIDYDKIKELKARREIALIANLSDGPFVVKRYWVYEQLIMLLSIMDKPIDFLVSVLE